MSNSKDRSLSNPNAIPAQDVFETMHPKGALTTAPAQPLKPATQQDQKADFVFDPAHYVPDRNWREQLLMFLVVICLLASSVASYGVMRDGLVLEWSRTLRDTDKFVFQATMICGIIALCMFCSWFATYSLGPRMLRNWAGACQFIMALLFTAFIVIMSSLLNAAAIMAPNILPLDMIRQTNIASAAVDNLTVSLIDAKGFINGSAGLEKDACTLSDREEAGGFVSRTGGGFGKASAQLSSACAQIRGLRVSLSKQIADSETKAKALSVALRDLRFKVDDPKISLLDREQELRVVMAKLEMLFREYRNAGLARTVENGIATLKSAVAPVDASSGLNKNTIAVINGLSSKFASAANDLERVRAAGSKAAKYTPLEYRSLTIMVLQYAHQFPSQMAMSLFLDIWQMWMLIFILLLGVGKMKWNQVRKERSKKRSLADDIKPLPVDPMVISLLAQSENRGNQ